MDAEQLVGSWLVGRAAVSAEGTLRFGPATRDGLPAKLRRAYHWIGSQAILSPFAELEGGTPRRLQRDPGLYR